MFYYPNRPMLVPPDPINPANPKPDYIKSLENQHKYLAFYKWNGDNVLINTSDMSFRNRQGKHLAYIPHPDMIKELERFPKNSILNGELLHRHTKNVKDLLILHCVMQWEGQPLQGKPWSYSRQLLESLGWLSYTWETALSYNSHVLLEQSHEHGFWEMFEEAIRCDNSIEGIILKDPSGILKLSAVPIADVSWMLKIRKPCKKYSF